jgi:hypothetical protein
MYRAYVVKEDVKEFELTWLAILPVDRTIPHRREY